MTTVFFDTQWPFDEPEGSLAKSANMLRWRKMGHLWCHWGVVAKHRFGEFGRIETEAGRLLLGGGAAWVNGFYGERYNWAWVDTPGADGMVKVRVDLGAQTMSLFWEAGWHAWHSDPHAAHGIFEAPLFERFPDGRVIDRRYFVSNEVVEGLPEIPAWVPKGTRFQIANNPEVTVGHGGLVLAAFTDWVPGFDPSRTYRVTASFMDARQTAGAAGIFRVMLMAVRWSDQATVRSRAMLDVFSQQQQLRSGQGTFLIPPGNAQIQMLAYHFIPDFPTVGTPGVNLFFPLWHARIELFDSGIQN